MEWADIVFLCKKGTPVKNSTYDTMLFKLCDKAGIDRFSMHVLRHTFATRCIEAEDFTNHSWTFQYRNHNEFVCSYHRRAKT